MCATVTSSPSYQLVPADNSPEPGAPLLPPAQLLPQPDDNPLDAEGAALPPVPPSVSSPTASISPRCGFK